MYDETLQIWFFIEFGYKLLSTQVQHDACNFLLDVLCSFSRATSKERSKNNFSGAIKSLEKSSISFWIDVI